ncbi:hypothetical protein CGMCC3_g17866 [Colletotrichum fructicola]|nr:uncharacterized protein CGMCC3_g17866 [Colletotrichum fructicola]KAE9565963.1 hypothetical protein CGMCC3_g17866 [Colletotrichum fructicola]KAF4422496.1 hypothetical protein CFRS1_v001557 [Colletotrichum fructicola]
MRTTATISQPRQTIIDPRDYLPHRPPQPPQPLQPKKPKKPQKLDYVQPKSQFDDEEGEEKGDGRFFSRLFESVRSGFRLSTVLQARSMDCVEVKVEQLASEHRLSLMDVDNVVAQTLEGDLFLHCDSVEEFNSLGHLVDNFDVQLHCLGGVLFRLNPPAWEALALVVDDTVSSRECVEQFFMLCRSVARLGLLVVNPAEAASLLREAKGNGEDSRLVDISQHPTLTSLWRLWVYCMVSLAGFEDGKCMSYQESWLRGRSERAPPAMGLGTATATGPTVAPMVPAVLSPFCMVISIVETEIFQCNHVLNILA